MVVCSLCKHDGHLKKDCPEDFKKVQLEPLPALTPEFLSVLNKVCEQCYSEYHLIPPCPLLTFLVSLFIYCSFFLHFVFISFSFSPVKRDHNACVIVALYPL